MSRSMKKTSVVRHVQGAVVLAVALAGGGCGSTDPGAMVDPDCMAAQGPMLPWKTGNTWTYAVNDEGVVSTKMTVVGEMEPVGGMGPNKDLMAYRVVTHKGGMDETRSWQNPDGDGVIRYREQAFSATTGALELEEYWEPHKVHVDGSAAHRVGDATWLEIYKETKLPVMFAPSTHEARDRWTVLSACESVTVPAGTFTAVQLQKAGGSSTKIYWYVPGVGKVKESGGQLEELVSYSLVP